MRHVEPSHLLTPLLLVTLAVTPLGSRRRPKPPAWPKPASRRIRCRPRSAGVTLLAVHLHDSGRAHRLWQRPGRAAPGDLPLEGGLGNRGRLAAAGPQRPGRRQMAGPRGRSPRPGDRSLGARPRSARAQPHARGVPVPQHPEIRPVPASGAPSTSASVSRRRSASPRRFLESGLNGTARSRANALGAVPMAAAELAGPGPSFAGEDRGV